MYTWAQFKAAVLENLVYDSDRPEHLTFLTNQVRFAVLNLQRHIPQYREGHVSRYDSRTIAVKGNAGIVAIPEGMRVDHAYLRPERSFLSSVEGTPSAKITLPFPEDITGGAVALTLKIWVRGASPLAALISTDEGDTASKALAGDGSWEYHEITLNIADADDTTEIYLGFDGSDYVSLDWSEITIESGTFTDTTFLGEDEVERLRSTKKLTEYPWSRRNELITGDAPAGQPGYYAHNRSQLWAYDLDADILAQGATLTLEMTGRKLSFADADEVPFDEDAVKAASLYVDAEKISKLDKKATEGWKIMQQFERERMSIAADKNLEA